MKFRNWIEDENGLNSGFPELSAPVMPINRVPENPASAEVKRTGLQPQVDSKEIQTDAKEEQDKIVAIDTAISKIDSDISGQDKSQKISKFKEIWNNMKKKWDNIKIENPDNIEKRVSIGGLGGSTGDENYIDLMQSHPNLLPGTTNQMPTGAGLQ